jgi:protein-S-isoprenylcysteine O-methyltransferase Ste14
MEILGKSPVSPPVLMLGKVAMFFCCMLPFAPFLHYGPPLAECPLLRIAGITILAGGLSVVIAALIGLGNSAAVGLPDRKTELRTTGLYRFTRNPIYLGAFAMCAGSCLMALHLLNLLLFILTVGIHHTIIRREEAFLEGRFGGAWLEYRRGVPRYFGLIRKSR